MARHPTYPYETIAVGEAFDVPPPSKLHNVRSLASYYARKLGRRFEVRWVEDERVFEVSRLPDTPGSPVEVHVPRGVLGADTVAMDDAIEAARVRLDAEWDAKTRGAKAAVAAGKMSVAEYARFLDGISL